MIYVGCDQALQTTGYSVGSDGELKVYGTFKTKATDPIEKRLGTIGQELDKLMEQGDFDHLFFEDCQKQQNVETFKKLCYVHAAILLGCYGKNVPYTILSPSHGRSILKDKYNKSFGKARAEQKKAAQELVEKMCGVNVSSDEADAICIGVAGMLEHKKNESAF